MTNHTSYFSGANPALDNMAQIVTGHGYRYRGTGAIDARAAGDDTELEQARKALTGAGYSDVTQVPGHVSVEDGDLGLDIVRPGTARPRQWTLSFRSDCRILHGEDKAYAEQSRDRRFTDLRA